MDMKKCAGCNLWFPKIAECFDKDRASPTGLQSWCVECKDKWEASPEAHFRRMRAFLEKQEPESWRAWEDRSGGAWAEFLRKYEEQAGVCKWCGAGLREWQNGGHNLDRLDNSDAYKHTPQNTVFACLPCNLTRGRTRLMAWKPQIRGMVDEHGMGRIPWGEINDRFARVALRRCFHLAVAAPQLSLLKAVTP